MGSGLPWRRHWHCAVLHVRVIHRHRRLATLGRLRWHRHWHGAVVHWHRHAFGARFMRMWGCSLLCGRLPGTCLLRSGLLRSCVFLWRSFLCRRLLFGRRLGGHWHGHARHVLVLRNGGRGEGCDSNRTYRDKQFGLHDFNSNETSSRQGGSEILGMFGKSQARRGGGVAISPTKARWSVGTAETAQAGRTSSSCGGATAPTETAAHIEMQQLLPATLSWSAEPPIGIWQWPV